MEPCFFSVYINTLYSDTFILNVFNKYFHSIYESGNKIIIDVNIVDNEDYNAIKNLDFPDGFLFFRKKIDVDYNCLYENSIVACLNEFLTFVWDNGIPAVVASDFEHKLINKGGFNNKEIPFPSDIKN